MGACVSESSAFFAVVFQIAYLAYSVLTNCFPGPTGASSFVNITKCSVPDLTLTLIELPNQEGYYTFSAACRTKNGTCVSTNTD